MADIDYDYLAKSIEHAVRDGIESGAWLAADPKDARNIERLRAQFAGQAMAALMSRDEYDFWSTGTAEKALEHADELLKALGYELPATEEK